MIIEKGGFILMIIPILRIFDLKKAEEFYIDFLGFTCDWSHQFDDDMPVYCQISLNGIVIHLSEHHGDSSPGAALRIQIKDINKFHSSLPKEYRYARPGIENSPWNTKEITIGDPFFNRLTFYETN